MASGRDGGSACPAIHLSTAASVEIEIRTGIVSGRVCKRQRLMSIESCVVQSVRIDCSHVNIDNSSNKLVSMLHGEHVCIKVGNPLLTLLRNSKIA
jgi:hypothetical protein